MDLNPGNRYQMALKDILADTSNYGPIKTAIEKQDIDMLKLYIGFIGGYHLIKENRIDLIKKTFESFLCH